MGQQLSYLLGCSAYETKLSDGTFCRTIDSAEIIRLANQKKISGCKVEIAALEQEIIPERYLRNLRSLSLVDQIKLLASTVCIVGLGGLGGLVTETLARMGIGRMHLIDGDQFEAHNLNRQLLSTVNNIGRPKTEAAGHRVKAINPGLTVKTTQAYLNSDNADKLINSCELVVDCLDNIPSRFSLAAAAKRAGIPMVSAAIAGLSGHLTTIFPHDKGLETIFGPEDHSKMTKGVETRLGCLAPAVNVIASLESAEVLNVLLLKNNILKNKLLVVDLTDYTFETLRLS